MQRKKLPVMQGFLAAKRMGDWGYYVRFLGLGVLLLGAVIQVEFVAPLEAREAHLNIGEVNLKLDLMWEAMKTKGDDARVQYMDQHAGPFSPKQPLYYESNGSESENYAFIYLSGLLLTFLGELAILVNRWAKPKE